MDIKDINPRFVGTWTAIIFGSAYGYLSHGIAEAILFAVVAPFVVIVVFRLTQPTEEERAMGFSPSQKIELLITNVLFLGFLFLFSAGVVILLYYLINYLKN